MPSHHRDGRVPFTRPCSSHCGGKGRMPWGSDYRQVKARGTSLVHISGTMTTYWEQR